LYGYQSQSLETVTGWLNQKIAQGWPVRGA